MSALVLVADSDPFNLRLLSELCSTLGYEVMTAADGGAVLDAVARQQPSLVLMDAALPVMDGFQVLRILKADTGLRHVPVLLVTAEHDTASREQGFALGADDFVTKPYRTLEIQQRLRTVLRLHALRDVAGSAHDASRSDDPLTQMGTQSQLHIALDYEFTRAVRYKHPLSCIVARCVNYAELAARLGAAAPDAVAGPIAAVLKGGIRNVDHLFQFAPDEFAILLPETAIAGARIVVERMRGLLADPALFGEALSPQVVVASASYPKFTAGDGEALWRSARRGLGV